MNFIESAFDLTCNANGGTCDTTVSIPASHTLYAHWTKISTPEPDTPSSKILDFTDLAYHFSNNGSSFGYGDSYKIPYSAFKRLWGSGTLAKYYYTYYNAIWSGSCYGMSLSSIMFNTDGDDIIISDFNNAATAVSSLTIGDTSDNLNITLTQLIETMQVSQYDTSITSTIQKNYDDLEGLCKEITQNDTIKSPVLICIYGPEGGHAIVGYKLKKINTTTSHLYVYDCNYPESLRYITLTTNTSGAYTGWYYHLNNIYDWGSSYSGCKISYVTYDTFVSKWNSRGSSKTESVNVLNMNTDSADIYDYSGKKVASLKNGVLTSTTDKIYQYQPLKLKDDSTSSNTEGSLIYLPTDLYIIKNKKSSVKEFQVNMVNVKQSVSVTTTANQVTLSVDDSEQLNTASIPADQGDSYNVILESSLSCSKNKSSIEYYGIGNGTTVTLGTNAGNCILTNCSDVTMWINGTALGNETDSSQKDISSASMVLSKTKYTYNQQNYEPDVTVTYNKSVLERGTDYVVVYKNNINVGTASATVYGIGKYTGQKTLTFKIEGKTPVLTFKQTSVSKTYGNAAFTNSLTSKKTDGTITYKSSNTKVAKVDSKGKVTITGAGTAKITAFASAGKTYKAGSKSYTLTVAKAANTITVSSVTKTASASSQTFTLKPSVKGNAKLTYSSSSKKVTVNSSGKVTIAKDFVGTATITIKAASTTNYKSASKKITVTVKPGGTSLSKLTNISGKKLTATWKRNSKVSGYRIQYSTSSSFSSNVHTIKITGNSTLKRTITNLTKNRTYYVRIQTYKTVSGKTYYSKWSGKKSIKIVR